jgi:hypothetical protein
MRMEGKYDGGGTRGSLRLALFTAKQTAEADGWLEFNIGREFLYVPFHGEYTCANDGCRLSATCTQSVPPQASAPYFRSGDRIVLSGNQHQALEGSLEADSQEVFKEGNQNVRYELKFFAR